MQAREVREAASLTLAFVCGAIGIFLIGLVLRSLALRVIIPISTLQTDYLAISAIFSLALSFALNKGKPPLALLRKKPR
jgi:hypothetical protein